MKIFKVAIVLLNCVVSVFAGVQLTPEEIWQEGASWSEVYSLRNGRTWFYDYKLDGTLEYDGNTYLRVVQNGAPTCYGVRLDGAMLRVAVEVKDVRETVKTYLLDYYDYNRFGKDEVAGHQMISIDDDTKEISVVNSGEYSFATQQWCPCIDGSDRGVMVYVDQYVDPEPGCSWNPWWTTMAAMNIGIVGWDSLINPFAGPVPGCDFMQYTLDFRSSDGIVLFRNPYYDQIMNLVSGVDSPIVDMNEENPPRYFNLQGNPVAKPRAGELVVKVTDAGTEKIIYEENN